MKILGVCGSQRSVEVSWTDRLLRCALVASGHDYTLIRLKGQVITACDCCFDCRTDHICKKDDAMSLIRNDIVTADAFMVGGVSYGATMNAAMSSFFDRWFQFGGDSRRFFDGIPGIAIGVNWNAGQKPEDEIEKVFEYYGIRTIRKISLQMAGTSASLDAPGAVSGRWLEEASEAGRFLGKRLAKKEDP